tara:strand:+ start:1321 stop:1671 length:351 start_codon:yes stop_codon:yes gene_type:complete
MNVIPRELQGLTGFTVKELQFVVDSPIGEWVLAGTKGRKRIRQIVACIIQYDFEKGNWYTNDDIVHLCELRDANGPSKMNISNQRISSLMRYLVAKGFLVQRTVKGMREYSKGDEQ